MRMELISMRILLIIVCSFLAQSCALLYVPIKQTVPAPKMARVEVVSAVTGNPLPQAIVRSVVTDGSYSSSLTIGISGSEGEFNEVSPIYHTLEYQQSGVFFTTTPKELWSYYRVDFPFGFPLHFGKKKYDSILLIDARDYESVCLPSSVSKLYGEHTIFSKSSLAEGSVRPFFEIRLDSMKIGLIPKTKRAEQAMPKPGQKENSGHSAEVDK